MKLSIKQKFFAVYILLLLFCFLILNSYGQNAVYRQLAAKEETKLYEEAALIVKDYVPNMNQISENRSSLQKYLSSLENLTDMRIWLVDSSGEILLDSSQDSSCQGENINQYDDTFLSNQSASGDTLKELLKENMISVIYPVVDSLDTSGYIVLMSPETILRQESFQYIESLLVCFSILFAAGSLLFLYLFRQTAHPVKAITKTTMQYADGHFEVPMPKNSTTEFAELATAIQYLAERMNGLNQYQKNFIANVSHDFRSPLTSIKGYAQALADGTIPYEMQKKYLDIIIFETERLTKLTSSLLTLNQMEQNGMVLERAPFDINAAIRSTAAAFEQICSKKKISLELTFSRPALLVDGDVSKIQQVLQNLLDNAVKFSPNDSVIEIQVTEQAKKVFIAVRDHGIGIPKDSIQKIWTRFYKTDISRGKDKTGTGLGLSITREIISAHGENINVISTEGVGTEFIFCLPIAD